MKDLYMGCDGKVEPNKEAFREFFGKIVPHTVIAEEKYDGMWGALIFDKNGKVEIISRNGKPKNPIGLREHLEQLKIKNTTIVGEMGFGSQAETERAKKVGHHRFVAFDILEYQGKQVTTRELLQRKDLLAKAVLDSGAKSELLSVSPFYIETDAKRMWDRYMKVVDGGGEGLILKVGATYYNAGSRHKHWFKVKKVVSKEYKVCGYEDSDSVKYGPKGWIKNIILCEINDPKMKEILRCGSMDEETRELFSKNRSKMLGTIVEIGGNEIFKSGSMRHPYFLRFREDRS